MRDEADLDQRRRHARTGKDQQRRLLDAARRRPGPLHQAVLDEARQHRRIVARLPQRQVIQDALDRRGSLR